MKTLDLDHVDVIFQHFLSLSVIIFFVSMRINNSPLHIFLWFFFNIIQWRTKYNFMIADTDNIIKENLRIDHSCLDYLELVPHLTGQRPSVFENICHSQYLSNFSNGYFKIGIINF